jgi:SAM-dependent methyltransferase
MDRVLMADPTIDPRDVMRRYSVEELCETADEYFRVVSDPTPLMVKPFAFLHETPHMLENLGLLLGGLQLGRTMTVLDFGAGTCWLSRILAQLNCQPICCDASRTALDIGRRLFAELPLLGTAVFAPKFLWFDGHRVDLPDASVDRIVCFDAFHHVPNPGEVIAEFARVLKPGGIAGFSEPGRGHSRTAQSQYEMRNHRVLENDVNVEEIFAWAQPAGFTDLSLSVVSDMRISLADHRVLLGAGDAESLRASLWNHTYNAMHNRAIFFLHKGPFEQDSRSHIGLGHTMTIVPDAYVIESSRPLRLTVSLQNTGQARWLHQNSEIFGIVRLGSHLYDGDGRLMSIDYSRHALTASVAPGGALTQDVEVMLPGPGRFELVFDLVAEGVSWFENQGSDPVKLKVHVRDTVSRDTA